MNNMFYRTEMLLGKDSLETLKNSRVAVFGLGGVGGYVAEALVRSGLGAIDLIDSDTIDITNLNRQIFATQNTVGANKTDAAEKRLLEINPNLKIKKHNTFFLPENSDEFDFKKYDYIVDAIDTVTAKIELVMKSNENGVPIISSMGTGNKLNAYLLEVSDIYKTSVCPLARVMRYELKKRGIKKLKVVYSKEEAIKTGIVDPENGKAIPASCIFVPAAAGLIIAGEVVKDLIKL